MKALLVCVLAALVSGGAFAQLALPSAAPPTGPLSASTAAPKSLKSKPHRRKIRQPSALSADPAGVASRELRQNGRSGDLQFDQGDDDSLRIVKFSMLGEVVSDPSRLCRIEIVADQPIAATPAGAPDGLPRYHADIPACPLTFDVVDGAVLVPPQSNACVFTAADCQASPSGLWGPELAEIEKDPKAISKQRAAADRSIQESLRVMEKRDKDAAASLAREESDFAADRDEVCHGYAGESRLGFCAARLAQSRSALLALRAKQAGPATAEDGKSRRHKKHAVDE
jgi:hypothetical protein